WFLVWSLVETLAGGSNQVVREAPQVPPPGRSSTTAMVEIASRARAQERAGDLQGALTAWREAAFLLPEDAAVWLEVKVVSRGLARKKLSQAKEALKSEATGL